jgi:hypothetical protein
LDTLHYGTHKHPDMNDLIVAGKARVGIEVPVAVF